MDLTLETIADFLDDYQSFVESERQAEFLQFRAGFERIRGPFERLQRQEYQRQHTQAPQFNIFHLMGIARREEKTHSAFLAHLLNPKAAHGQGVLFLKAFLKMCAQAHPSFPSFDDNDLGIRWQVWIERSVPQGRLDIVVESAELGYLFVIENKVDANEQADQLRRYADWMQSREELFPIQALIFLTPRGDSAHSHGGAAYFPLSYCRNVYRWLTNTLDKIAAPTVRETVRQYAALIETL